MTLYDACKIINEKGGATLKFYWCDWTLLERKRGYAVSLNGYEKTYKYKDVNDLYHKVIDYFDENTRLLTQKNRYLGVWINNGVIYLYITIVVNNKVKALLRGSLEKQQAIYDFSKNKSLYIDDYKYLIDNVVLFEQVDMLTIIDELEPKTVLHSKQLDYCNAWLVCYRVNYTSIFVYYFYNTIVFIQINDKLYFNRLNYSSTTTQYIHKFIKKYNLKSLSWYQLIKGEWYKLIRQLGLYTEYGPNYDYSNNNCKWLIDIEEVTR